MHFQCHRSGARATLWREAVYLVPHLRGKHEDVTRVDINEACGLVVVARQGGMKKPPLRARDLHLVVESAAAEILVRVEATLAVRRASTAAVIDGGRLLDERRLRALERAG